MSHYKQSLVIEATPDAVYAALTTPQGLRGWWTQDCDVDTAVGGTLKFRFGPHYKHMRIEQLEPNREVRWLCTVAHIDVDSFTRKDEWVGTQIVFHLSPQGKGQTRLDFEHVGLVPSFECHEVCVAGWTSFIESLRLYAETGTGTPWSVCEAEKLNAAQRAQDKETPASTDRIERSVVIQAPRDRVWKALSNAETFGTWFGANLKGQQFVPGQRTQGPLTIANLEHVKFDVIVERVEPKNMMSYRWHPAALDPSMDYEQEPRTLVTFTLADLPGNQTRLTVVETGFDNVPPNRRLEAFRMNSNGWGWQADNVKRYAESHVEA
ncbi:MAG: hypothetical protein JWL63_3259 [Rhodocyclales bacterium]|nr:hypothetical protein [Rhodocyclales bacterium]